MHTKKCPFAMLPEWLIAHITEKNSISELYLRFMLLLKHNAEHLILRALKASKHSTSHRPFPVGCAVLAFSKHSGTNTADVFTGHNMKVHKDARVTCGEVVAVGAARQSGFDFVPLIVVVGKPQPDQGSGLESPTLHPCYRCRAEFETYIELGIMTPETLVITVTLDGATMLKEDTDSMCEHLTLFEKNRGILGSPVQAVTIRKEDPDPKVFFDDLLREGLAEVRTVKQLLELHAGHTLCNH
jgi:cytidine deaminase